MDDVQSRQKSTIRAAFGLSVTHWTCFAVEMSLLAYIAKDLEIDDIRFGYLNTVTALAQLLSSPIYSRLAGTNLRSAVTIAFLSSASSYFLTAVSNGFWLLLLSRIAAAFGHAGMAAQTAIASATKPEERTAAFGKLGATFGIGFVVGSAAGGIAAKATGLRAPLLAASALCAVAAFVTPSFIKIEAKKTDKKSDDEGDSQGVQGYLRLLSSAKVSGILLIKTLTMAPMTTMLTIFGVYLINEFKTEPGSNAMLTVYVGLCMTAMNAAGVGFLKKYFDDRGLLIKGIVAFALTGVSVILAGQYFHFFFVMTSLAVGMSLVGSSTDSMLTSSVRASDHALVLGLAWAVDSLTRVTAPTLAGFMLTGYGFASFGYVEVVGTLGAAALTLLFL